MDKNTADKLDFQVEFTGDNSEYNYGSGTVQVFTVPKDAIKIPDEPKNRYGDKWYEWYYKWGDGRAQQRHMIFDAYITQEESCCGFAVIGGLDSCDDPKLFKKIAEPAGKEFGKKLKKYKYLSAYVPDTKQYETVQKFLEAAGFKPGTSVKSNHGRYTNTRWEYQPEKVKREKALSSSIV
jgi:hypothetical protein